MQPYGTTILKAAKILNYIASCSKAQPLNQISAETNMNKATVFKILETLQVIGYVEKERDARYRLGIRLVELSRLALNQLDIVKIVEPYIEVLNYQSGETVHFGVLGKSEVIYVSKLESKQVVRMYSRVGNASPLYCTGIGKAILSTFSEEKLDKYISEVTFRRYTENTIVTSHDLRAELSKIRLMGYSVDNCEHERDVRCIAVPIYTNGYLYGALSLTSPSYRMTDKALETFLPLLKECREGILERLKFLT